MRFPDFTRVFQRAVAAAPCLRPGAGPLSVAVLGEQRTLSALKRAINTLISAVEKCPAGPTGPCEPELARELLKDKLYFLLCSVVIRAQWEEIARGYVRADAAARQVAETCCQLVVLLCHLAASVELAARADSVARSSAGAELR